METARGCVGAGCVCEGPRGGGEADTCPGYLPRRQSSGLGGSPRDGGATRAACDAGAAAPRGLRPLQLCCSPTFVHLRVSPGRRRSGAYCEGAGDSGRSKRGETERNRVWVWKWRRETEGSEQARPKLGAGQGGDECDGECKRLWVLNLSNRSRPLFNLRNRSREMDEATALCQQ